MSETAPDESPVVTRWHCEYAWVSGREEVERDVLITATNGEISAVELGVAPPSNAARLRGVVLPGFANAHSHAFHRALRGRTEVGLSSFWSWRDVMYDAAARLTPDTYRSLATAVFAEMLCAGYTCVGEFHYLHHDVDGRPYGEPNEMSLAILDAASEVGIRITLLDTCYLESAPGKPPEGVQRRFTDGSAAAWAARVDALAVPQRGVRLGAAVHSVRAVPVAASEVVAAWSRAREAPLHAHVSEQRRENEESIAAYGRTPTELLGDAGALHAGFTAVHATHLTDNDRELLGQAGTFVAICPTTERALGDGLCELSALRDAGAALCVGTDSHALIDPFDELRCLEGHERLRTESRGNLAPAELLGATCRTGHASLGWDAGRLVAGVPCDLVAVSLDSKRLSGSDPDRLLESLVAGATAADVTDVVMDGSSVVSDGAHRWVDVEGALSQSIRELWT